MASHYHKNIFFSNHQHHLILQSFHKVGAVELYLVSFDAPFTKKKEVIKHIDATTFD